MTLAGTAAQLAARSASRLRGPRLSVLIFHRVLPATDPLFPTEIDRTRFEQLMRLVRQAFDVLPLVEAVERAGDGTLPPRAAAITFDDGYADNHDVAWPVLRQLGLPATVFVSSGFLDGGRMWNDTLIEAVRLSRRDMVDLPEFGLQRAPLQTWQQRRHAIECLIGKVKYMSLGDRQVALTRVLQVLAVDRLPSDLMMRSDQVRTLHAQGVGIGAHTVDHPILQTLPDHESERQIVAGRQALQDLLQAPVPLFAYPNGRPDRDFSAAHVELVRRAGFRAAFTTAPGVVRRGDDPMQLGRFTPWDRDPRRWILRLAMHHALQ